MPRTACPSSSACARGAVGVGSGAAPGTWAASRAPSTCSPCCGSAAWSCSSCCRPTSSRAGHSGPACWCSGWPGACAFAIAFAARLRAADGTGRRCAASRRLDPGARRIQTAFRGRDGYFKIGTSRRTENDMSRYAFALFFLLSLGASAQVQPFGTSGSPGTSPSIGGLPGSISQPGGLSGVPPTAGTTFPNTLGGAAPFGPNTGLGTPGLGSTSTPGSISTFGGTSAPLGGNSILGGSSTFGGSAFGGTSTFGGTSAPLGGTSPLGGNSTFGGSSFGGTSTFGGTSAPLGGTSTFGGTWPLGGTMP